MAAAVGDVASVAASSASTAPALSASSSTSTSVPEFFATHPVPKDFEQRHADTQDFIEHMTTMSTVVPPSQQTEVHSAVEASDGGPRIVCVTSGGTTVPLERNTVRFIDNFSTKSNSL